MDDQEWRLGVQKVGFTPRLIWQESPIWHLQNPHSTDLKEPRLGKCQLGDTYAGSMQKRLAEKFVLPISYAKYMPGEGLH
eukprot:1147287-Pelagomonas_calceolata.AAC.1